jgi:hypothetical protein
MVSDTAKLQLPVMAYPISKVLTTAITRQVKDLARDLVLVTDTINNLFQGLLVSLRL